jgi:hypothetical protein
MTDPPGGTQGDQRGCASTAVLANGDASAPKGSFQPRKAHMGTDRSPTATLRVARVGAETGDARPVAERCA